MRIQVKIVVFEHPEPQTFGNYCGYCAANGYFCSGVNITDVVNKIKSVVILELQHRDKYPTHLKKYDWKIDEDSISPPNFTDEKLLNLTEESYVIEITNYKIIELDVEIPTPKALF